MTLIETVFLRNQLVVLQKIVRELLARFKTALYVCATKEKPIGFD